MMDDSSNTVNLKTANTSMSALSDSQSILTTTEALQAQFARMYQLSRQQPINNWATRLEQLDNLEAMLRDKQSDFALAISADFKHRSHSETQLAELYPSFSGITYAKKHGKAWMKTRRVGISALYLPAHNEVQPQPLGVVGIMVPWNYPLYLAIGPMIDALCAGNRVLVKMSESAPQFAQCFAEAVAHYFSPDMVAVAVGDVELAEAFSRLPLDHLLYTGSTAVGKKVMRAAADNLTPVTLELGGKSPVIVLDNALLENVVNRVMMGKTLNAGQTCIAPDYVLLPRQYHQHFIALAKEWFAKHYPDIGNNTDYSHIINDAHLQRVQKYLDAQPDDIIYPVSELPTDTETRFMPPVIVAEPELDSDLMQEEIFAPILPLVHYDTLDEAIAFVNSRPRPLALYVFGQKESAIERVRLKTTSGGMCVNEVLVHVAQHELPFGGIGHSGIGAYHGKTGFDRFSHLKPVFVQSKLNGMRLLLPPYGELFKKGMALLLK